MERADLFDAQRELGSVMSAVLESLSQLEWRKASRLPARRSSETTRGLAALSLLRRRRRLNAFDSAEHVPPLRARRAGGTIIDGKSDR